MPVGLTKHRKGLMELKSVTKEYAITFINDMKNISENYKGEVNPFILLFTNPYF